jgi:hypothetical protein
MTCDEALLRLSAQQSEFGARFFEWSLVDSQRELEQGFPLVREISSSVVGLFLEYVAEHPRDQVRALMSGLIKRLNPLGAELAGRRLTDDEQRAEQSFEEFRKPRVVRAGQELRPLRISALEQNAREQEHRGDITLGLDKRAFRKTLEYTLQPLLGSPGKNKSCLRYWTNVSGWFVLTDLDLGGRYQLSCIQQIHARPTLDGCVTRLWDTSFLAWCGVHPATRFDLIASHEMERAAESARKMFAHLLDEMPNLLAGLSNDIPLELTS